MTEQLHDHNETPRPNLSLVADNTTQGIQEMSEGHGEPIDPRETEAARPTVFDQDDPKHALIDHQEPEGQTAHARPWTEIGNFYTSKAALRQRTADVLGVSLEDLPEPAHQRAIKRASIVGKGVFSLISDVVKSIVGYGEERISEPNPAQGLAALAKRQASTRLITEGTRTNVTTTKYKQV